MGPRVYIHEFIDIRGHNRARYLHHVTANWAPVVGTNGAPPSIDNSFLSITSPRPADFDSSETFITIAVSAGCNGALAYYRLRRAPAVTA